MEKKVYDQMHAKAKAKNPEASELKEDPGFIKPQPEIVKKPFFKKKV